MRRFSYTKLIRGKLIGIWSIMIIIIIPLFWIYHHHKKSCNFSIKHEISMLNSTFQQSSQSEFVKGLEFRYVWHKINQYEMIFQPFWYLIEPSVCTKKEHATILVYIAITPDENGLLIRNLIRNTWAIEAKNNGIE
ncbi:unnamed protein product, partial [Wuchereria bancrofti]